MIKTGRLPAAIMHGCPMLSLSMVQAIQPFVSNSWKVDRTGVETRGSHYQPKSTNHLIGEVHVCSMVDQFPDNPHISLLGRHHESCLPRVLGSS